MNTKARILAQVLAGGDEPETADLIYAQKIAGGGGGVRGGTIPAQNSFGVPTCRYYNTSSGIVTDSNGTIKASITDAERVWVYQSDTDGSGKYQIRVIGASRQPFSGSSSWTSDGKTVYFKQQGAYAADLVSTPEAIHDNTIFRYPANTSLGFERLSWVMIYEGVDD